MTCECCDQARQSTDYRTYSMGCIWCGARYFRSLKEWPPPRSMPDGSAETKAQRQEWRAKVRDDWIAWGHNRETFMQLASGENAPFAPVNRRKKE